ncbi:MAG: hypothetical protein PHI97_29235 [Desulfobulbus sp.]|nr:hypothetical protein [Desulfobulbus sp.]
MNNRALNHNDAVGRISFPPTETVYIDDATMKRLLAEGMEICRSIEKSAASMFMALGTSTRMR